MMPATGDGGRRVDGTGRALIAVGRITRPVGLKGEMALELMADDRERLRSVERVWVGASPDKALIHQMQHMRLTRAAVVVKISDVDSRARAEDFRGQYVFVDEKGSPGPGPGSFYVHDVVGLEVVDEEGAHIGTISEVQKLPSQDIWIVLRGGREIMIPAVSEFIRSVELDRRRVVVRLIEGLIDEN